MGVAEVASESKQRHCRFLDLDSQGWLQALGGIAVGLIALYSSNNHIVFFGSNIGISPQRVCCFIIASLCWQLPDGRVIIATWQSRIR